MSIFFVIFIAVFGVINLYTWFRFVRRLALPLLMRRLFSALLLLIFIMAAGYLPLRHTGSLADEWMEPFALAVGAGFVFFVLAALYDLARLATDRMVFLHTRFARFNLLLDGFIVFAGVGYLIWGLYEAYQPPVITQSEIRVAQLSGPVRIVQLSDLHLGNGSGLDTGFATEVADRVNGLQPDLVAITGDLIDAPLEKVKPALEQIAAIKSRYGTFFVLGNHEYFYDPEETMDYLESLGVKVLRNNSARIDAPQGRLEIVGLYDRFGERIGRLIPDAQAAMKQADPNATVIVLAHQPKLALDFEPESFDLLLSGHTHGGQIFPFGLLVRLDQPYLRGLYRHDSRGFVYVSSGTGYWGPPLRMFAPSEIAVITLNPLQ